MTHYYDHMLALIEGCLDFGFRIDSVSRKHCRLIISYPKPIWKFDVTVMIEPTLWLEFDPEGESVMIKPIRGCEKLTKEETITNLTPERIKQLAIYLGWMTFERAAKSGEREYQDRMTEYLRFTSEWDELMDEWRKRLSRDSLEHYFAPGDGGDYALLTSAGYREFSDLFDREHRGQDYWKYRPLTITFDNVIDVAF